MNKFFLQKDIQAIEYRPITSSLNNLSIQASRSTF